MSEAVIGLVGVVVGGVLTGGTNLALEWRRERRAGRAAARLVHAALTDANAFVEASIFQRMWVGDPVEALADDVWSEHRTSLAEAPGFDGWYPVAGAWCWIGQLRHLVELFGEEAGSDPLEDREEDYFRLGLLQTRIAATALVDYAKTKSYREPGTDVEPSANVESGGPDLEEDDGRWLPENDPIEMLLEAARNAKPAKPKRKRR